MILDLKSVFVVVSDRGHQNNCPFCLLPNPIFERENLFSCFDRVGHGTCHDSWDRTLLVLCFPLRVPDNAILDVSQKEWNRKMKKVMDDLQKRLSIELDDICLGSYLEWFV